MRLRVRQLMAGLACGALWHVAGMPAHAADVGDGASSVITTAAEFETLSVEQLAQEHPLRIEGTILYVDLEWRVLWLGDGTGVIFVNPDEGTQGLEVGQRVRLSGKSAVKDGGGWVKDPVFEVVGAGRLPDPLLLTADRLKQDSPPVGRVQFSGVVRVWDAGSGRLRMEVVNASARVQVHVRDFEAPDLVYLQDARIQVVGLAAPLLNPPPGLEDFQIFVRDLAEVLILEQGPVDSFAGPEATIREVITAVQQPDFEAAHRVHLRGKVTEVLSSNRLELADDTGRMAVIGSFDPLPAVGDGVEVAGFPARAGEGIRLEDAEVRAALPSVKTADQPVLRSIEAIRKLSPEEAAKHLPVEIEAVVTYYDPNWRVLFVHAEGQGIYVNAKSSRLRLAAGDRVRITGVTGPGGYAPIIDYPRVERLGAGTLPDPGQFSLARLLSGAEDSQWVELKGVVRAVRLAAPNLELDLANAGVHFGAYVAGWGGTAPPTNWVGSHVVMRGVCGVRFNAERQLLGLVIHVPGQEYLGFGEPPPDDPFDRPVAPVADLLRFTSSGNQDALVKVNGVTTHNRGGWLGLQDASGGLLLRVSTNITVTPGQQIEVLGFPSPGDFTPTLEQPVFRALGPAEMPEPADASPRDLATGAMNGRLVRVQGRLVEQIGLQRRLWLTLSDQGLVFQVRVARDRTDRRPLLYRRNSLLEVVGVCQVVADAWQQPRAVRLWVNGPEDVRVVEAPPWLQVRHVALAGGGLLVVALGALLWVRALRRKVGEQTAELRRRYEAETALKEQFRGLFENAGDLIFTLDPEGRFLSLNQAAERVFGQDREALVGKPVAALLAKEDVSRLESALARLRNDGSVEPLEVRLGEGVGPATSAGAIIELNLQSIRREGALTGFQAIGRDRTEQHHLEAQVRQMQRVESVGRLAGGVAHDFNNVLAVILGNTEMALQNLPEGSPLHEQLQEINQAARRSADLTRQLLAFARRQTVQPRVVDLNEVVASMLKMLQRLIGEDVELLWLPGKDLPRVKIDPAQVDQILANLAVNARDAISGVGKLTIATSRITADESFQAAHPGLASGDYVRLEVADTGHGMDEETRAHIFEPFYTTKETGQGTGLGLATVHGIVQQNQGWIDVDSRPGQGTAFAIYLPAAAEATRSQAADAQPASPAEPAAEARGNETILMVEDEPSVLKPARIILESRGYTVLAATTPSEALRLAAEHAGEIRLLISDVVMPEMNGRELQERVATLCPHLRTLFISGYTRDVIARQGVIEEGVDFLSKPFSLKGLAAKVRSMLDQPPRPGNGSASATDQAGEVGVAETTGETPPKG